ncbi:hypothetical protein [Microbacterium sp. NPDC056052]|uniref:hypothetical protein n=1 Tax=Microbacterium sp. NPDC056052 TaxID=3345695 RepID=UPI0035E02967
MTTDAERDAEFDRLVEAVRVAIGGLPHRLVRGLFDEGVRVTPLLPVVHKLYTVCDRLLDPETNRHCEFDGDVTFIDGRGRCPWCFRAMTEEEAEEESR